MDGQTPPATPDPRATLVVCTTCRNRAMPEEAIPDGMVADGQDRAGVRLHAALVAAAMPDGVTVKAVECLSVCSDGCTVALQSPGKWTYVYGRLNPETHVADLLHGAALYAASADGVVPWRERPEVFRKQSVARIPPLEQP